MTVGGEEVVVANEVTTDNNKQNERNSNIVGGILGRPQVGKQYRTFHGTTIQHIDTEIFKCPNGKIRTRYKMTMSNGLYMVEDFYETDENDKIIHGDKFEDMKLDTIQFPYYELTENIKLANSSSFNNSSSNITKLFNTSCTSFTTTTSMTLSDDTDHNVRDVNDVEQEQQDHHHEEAAAAKTAPPKQETKKKEPAAMMTTTTSTAQVNVDVVPTSNEKEVSGNPQQDKEVEDDSSLSLEQGVDTPTKDDSTDSQKEVVDDYASSSSLSQSLITPRADHKKQQKQQDLDCIIPSSPRVVSKLNHSVGKLDTKRLSLFAGGSPVAPPKSTSSVFVSTPKRYTMSYPPPPLHHPLPLIPLPYSSSSSPASSSSPTTKPPRAITTTSTPSKEKEKQVQQPQAQPKRNIKDIISLFQKPQKVMIYPKSKLPVTVTTSSSTSSNGDNEDQSPIPSTATLLGVWSFGVGSNNGDAGTGGAGAASTTKDEETKADDDHHDNASNNHDDWRPLEVELHPFQHQEEKEETPEDILIRNMMNKEDVIYGVWGFAPGSSAAADTADGDEFHPDNGIDDTNHNGGYNPKDLLCFPPGVEPTSTPIDDDDVKDDAVVTKKSWRAQGIWTTPGKLKIDWPPLPKSKTEPTMKSRTSNYQERKGQREEQIGTLKRQETTNTTTARTQEPKTQVAKGSSPSKLFSSSTWVYPKSIVPKKGMVTGKSDDEIDDSKPDRPTSKNGAVWTFGVGSDDTQVKECEEWEPQEVKLYETTTPAGKGGLPDDIVLKDDAIYGVWGFAPGADIPDCDDDGCWNPDELWCFPPGEAPPSSTTGDDSTEENFQPKGIWAFTDQDGCWPPPTREKKVEQELPPENPLGVRNVEWKQRSVRVYPESKLPSSEPTRCTGSSDGSESDPPVLSAVWKFVVGSDVDEGVVNDWDPQNVIFHSKGQEPSTLEEESIPHGIWGLANGCDGDEKSIDDFAPEDIWVFGPGESPPEDDFTPCGVWTFDPGNDDEESIDLCWPPLSSNKEVEDSSKSYATPVEHVTLSPYHSSRRVSAPPSSSPKSAASAFESPSADDKIRVKSTMGKWSDPFNYTPDKKKKKKRGKYI